MQDSQFKVTICGSAGVGKTSLIQRFVDNAFTEDSVPTTNSDEYIKPITVDGTTVTLQIFDTCGQERYNSLTSSYHRGAKAVILCYAINDADSLREDLVIQMKEIERYAPQGIFKILVGTKSDLKDHVAVSYEEGEAFAKSHDMMFLESSAKDNINVEKVFQTTGENIWNKAKTEQKTRSTIQLNPEPTKSKSKCILL